MKREYKKLMWAAIGVFIVGALTACKVDKEYVTEVYLPPDSADVLVCPIVRDTVYADTLYIFIDDNREDWCDKHPQHWKCDGTKP